MKRFYHPILKSDTLTTSKGKIVFDEKGSAEVEDEVFDHLMKNPANAEHQAKLNAQKELIQQQGGKKDDRLKVEDLKLLDPKALKAIAKERKIEFPANVTKDQLITSIMEDEDIKKPPPPPPSEP
jgi:hypothetical protein